jgi:hypothetical protein
VGTIDTVAALLAKAERTDNPHEAEAYLAKAQHLATLASIDLAAARTRTAGRERREQPVSRTVSVGERGKRANKHLVELFLAVAAANDVVCDVARNSTFVIPYGMPSDLDVTEALWQSLAHQMVASANAYLAGGAWRHEAYARIEVVGRIAWDTGDLRPHTAQTARAAFYQGFIARLRERLREAREEAIAARPSVPVGDDAAAGGAADAGAGGASGTSSGALVLAAKAEEVRRFHGASSRARGSWSGYRGSGHGDRGSATGAGRRAASAARLRDDPGLPGAGPALPR